MRAVAQEVADVLTDNGFKVFVRDYDIPIEVNFVEAMHEAIKNARDLIILFTRDYEESPHIRKEFTSFEAERLQGRADRHVIVLRCEDAPLRGLLAASVYQESARPDADFACRPKAAPWFANAKGFARSGNVGRISSATPGIGLLPPRCPA